MSQDLLSSLMSLRLELRDIARDIEDEAPVYADRIKTGADLLAVLAHITRGMSIRDAFGAPGDWGYNTPIGRAVLTLHEAALAAHPNAETFAIDYKGREMERGKPVTK